jgi:hypothetical protein
MTRFLITIAMLALLSGCAGLQTNWRLQLDMNYSTPEDAPKKAP